MRVVVLFSGSASSLEYLLECDPNLKVNYEFVGALTDNKNASGINLAHHARIPLEILDYREFVKSKGAKFSDMAVRDKYFQKVVEVLDKWQPDIVIQSGFMLITTRSFLERFAGRILNVHPADLTIQDESGKRKYTGLHVVERALADGATETKSTIHLVTEGVDEGPIITLSEPLKVEAGIATDEHQKKMKTACDGPAYQRALELIANGSVWIDKNLQRIEIRE